MKETSFWQIHLLYVSNEQICTGEAQILLVGYIRGLSNKPCNGSFSTITVVLPPEPEYQNHNKEPLIPEIVQSEVQTYIC
ncbi:unnamed protein product [Camellia sinensis]